MDNIKEETISYFIKEANTARKDYDNRIKNLTNKFFKDNHIPLKVGDRVMIANNNKVGTIVSLHTEVYKDFRYYDVPMIRVELDENKDLEYVAALISIKKI